jgi:phosphate transport system substrate-binding protein
MPARRGFQWSRSRRAWLAITISAAVSLLPAVGQQAIFLVGSGSNVPSPLFEAWAQQFNKRNSRTQMRYLATGTSEGIEEISHASGDFAAGEIPLSAMQRTQGKLMAVPAVLIAIVPIYNVPEIHEELRFSGEVLAEIFLGEVKNWNSPDIAKLNPGVRFPDLAIRVVYRPAGKGSNYVLTDFLSKTSPKFRAQIGTTPSPHWPVGISAERNSDMVDKVRAESGTIGYIEAQYAVKAGLSYGAVQNASGTFVKASPETIRAACNAVEAPQWERFAASLTNPPGADSYPITSFSWLYLRTVSSDSRRAAALSDLLGWIYDDGQQVAAREGYSELPTELLHKVKTRIDSLR